MIVLIAGPSRTGSMWTYNVTRSLLLEAGKALLPHDVFNDVAAVRHALGAAGDMKPGEVYCIKAHVLLEAGLPVKIINNYRDVRDAMLSYMRFTRQTDFEQGLQFARTLMAETDHYFEQHHDNIIRIRYDRMTADPAGVIGDINCFLDLGVDAETIQAVADRFARDKVEALVQHLDRVTRDAAAMDSAARDRYIGIRNPDGSFRVFDKETNFQTNHISSRRPGEWREVFTPEQQQRLLALTAAWLERYGFEV